eukprot:CAMPEP_0117012816 /NCGR_PEP_ID=MMETSP0472-20121206/10700_1 /TAXON_ID=693140 ORGANISM="Tiarina fusus, Strain LIS" /NCGR_SAMPLE_ID=MMETSP0472 /ASSEMBLY_ACC=CAM_ASM_000603 /LENGTH=151 /DNA_ID=CAMNT_0004715971 /DNA_START=221 /DNA_END=676 /DNA_ORIENTATION=-
MTSTEVPKKPDTFLILSMAVDVADIGKDPKALWASKSERKQCSQKVRSTFKPAVAPNEPNFVETIQRQNDQLSRQVAQVENENNNLRAAVKQLNEDVTAKEAEQDEMTKTLERYQSTNYVPVKKAGTSHTKEFVRLLILFCLFLVVGYLLA